MPNIESLSFELILNDEQFNEKVKQVKDTASGLNTDISNILENIKKIGSGGGNTAPKKIVALESLRNEIKKTEAEITNLENKYTLLYRNAAKEDNGVFISNKKVDDKFRDLTNDAEALRMKLEELKKAYKELGGDKALSMSFKETKKATSDTSIELLQMREHYKNIEQSSKRVATSQKQMSQSTKEASTHLSSQSRIWREIAGLATAYFSVDGARRLVSNLIQVTAEFEKQRIALRAILQDVDGADAMFEQIKSLAVQSPFSFKELVTYTKQLSAYSIPIEELYDTTKMLADVSAGLGVGMDRLVLAYGQIRSAAFLRGTEVRQLTEAGIPIINELQKQFEAMGEAGITAGEVFDKISKRQVSFEMVEKVFKNMTSEGGKFYQMQNVLAETLSGKLSNLTDAYQIMFSEIGNKNKGAMVTAVDLARSLAENYEKIGRAIVELVAVYGTYKAAVLIMAVAEDVHHAAMVRGNFDIVKREALLKSLTKNSKAFAAIQKLLSNVNPYVAIGTAVATLGVVIAKNIKTTNEFQASLKGLKDGFNLNLTKDITEFETLWGKMRAAKEGTDEYNVARKNLFNRYDAEIQKLKAEGVEIANNNALYIALKNSIEDAARSRFRFTATDEIGATYDKTIKEIYNGRGQYSLEWLSKQLNLSKGEMETLWGLITGMITEEDIAKMDEYAGLLEKVNNGWVSMGSGDSGPRKASEALEELSNRASIAKNEYMEASAAIDKLWASTESATSGGNTDNLMPEVESPKETKDRVAAIREQIDAYKKLKDIYEDLVEYMSDSEAREFMKTFLPIDINVYDNFDNEIQHLVGTLKQLADAGNESAKSLLFSLGEENLRNQIEGIKTAQNAAKEYENFMKSWLDLGELSDDESFNISKVVAKYKKTIEQINQKKEEARKKLYEREDTSGKGYGLDFAHEYLAIDDKALTEQKNALATANNDIKKQAELWVKNWEGFKDVDLSRFSDLTAGELKKVRDAIEAMRQDPLNGLPEKIRKDLENSELGIDGFVQAILDALDTLENKNDEQLKKTTAEDFSRWADGFKEIASGLSEIGEASGNTNLVDIAEQMDKIAGTAVNVVKALASGDTFGAIIAAASYVANAWFEAIAGAEKFKATLRDLQSEMLAMKYASELALGTDTIFGDNTYASIKNASNLISKLEGSMNSLKTKFDQITVSTKKSKWWEFFLAPTASAAWAKLFTNKSLSVTDALDEMGVELMDENGRVNVDALQSLVDAYDGFSKAEKEAMENAIEEANAYNDALDQLNTAMESLTGSVAGDFASAIVEQWKSAGNAAADYSEILDDLATQYAEMMIKNTLLENVFDDDFKKQITDLTVAKDAAGVLDLFDSKVKQLEEYYPTFEEILNGLDQYFVKDEAGSDASTLSNGIKSITEDTANLLASYVNAIRADVAYNRMQLEQILGLLPSSPTLAEYLTQIQANTYNTAENTRVLMENINSVMTTSDGPAIRVFM